MDFSKSFRFYNRGLGLLLFLSLSLFSAQSLAENFPLEVLQPQPNLDTKNRFYKAYPGLEYNVRLAVIGGDYPYRYAISSGPSGMSIDKRGEITWSNPTESVNPYSVTVTITDAAARTKSVTWPITVTTNGFRFMDAVNGKSVANGGTGTKANPWKSMKDMYEGNDLAAKSASSYANEFLYFRNGTYPMDAYREDNGNRVAFTSNRKPQVWLAYPGEKPILDLALGHLIFYSGGDNTYIDGFEIKNNGNVRGVGIMINSNSDNITFRRNKLYGITTGATGSNSAHIRISRGSSIGKYWSIQDNEMHSVNNGYGILAYDVSHVLVENNTLHNINKHPIGPKAGTRMWFIRGNTMYNNPGDSIGLQYWNANNQQCGNIEISYNIVESDGGKVRINSNKSDVGLPVYIYRNTFMDEVQVLKATSTNGSFKFYENVIVNETSHPQKIQRTEIIDSSRVDVVNNLVGSASDNIVDSKGYLTIDYSNMVGTRGHQIGKRPSAATALNVIAQ